MPYLVRLHDSQVKYSIYLYIDVIYIQHTLFSRPHRHQINFTSVINFGFCSIQKKLSYSQPTRPTKPLHTYIQLNL